VGKHFVVIQSFREQSVDCIPFGNGERGNLLMFFSFRIKFFAGDYQPRRNESESPPQHRQEELLPAGQSQTAEPKLALENAAERTLEPAALQLTNFLARLYFLATRR